MQQLNKPRPDIRFHQDGLIELLSSASRKLSLEKEVSISFVIDSENNLYIKKDPKEGLLPSSAKGRFIRYKSVKVTQKVFSLPDVPTGLTKAAFRIGEIENNLYPIITRKVF